MPLNAVWRAVRRGGGPRLYGVGVGARSTVSSVVGRIWAHFLERVANFRKE
jgi:hypothetical protein